MLKFKNFNVNPKGKKTGDCSTRALAPLINLTWEETLLKQVESAIKTGYEPADRRTIERVAAQYGFSKHKQPRKLDNTKYLVREMDKVLTKKQLKAGVVVNAANHYVFIKDDYYQDTWESGWKTVGNYYGK